jgi:hypothetical protein
LGKGSGSGSSEKCSGEKEFGVHGQKS